MLGELFSFFKDFCKEVSKHIFYLKKHIILEFRDLPRGVCYTAFMYVRRVCVTFKQERDKTTTVKQFRND